MERLDLHTTMYYIATWLANGLLKTVHDFYQTFQAKLLYTINNLKL